MDSLGPCTVCGEMVYEDDGEDMATAAGAEGEYEHFDCLPDPPAPGTRLVP